MNLQLLNEISGLSGTSNNEQAVVEYLAKVFRNAGLEVSYDGLGSCFGQASFSKSKKMLVFGPTDEIGFLGAALRDQTLEALLLGNPSPAALIGKLVTVGGIQGTIIRHSDGSIIDERHMVAVYIGDGLAPDAVVGHYFTMTPVLVQLGEQHMQYYSTNINGRVAAYVLSAIAPLAARALDYQLVLGGTVQKQVGLRGVQTAANQIQPDVAIAIDVAEAETGALGHGPYLTYYDKTLLPNQAMLRLFEKVASEHHLPLQHLFNQEESEGGWMNKLGTGTPTVVLNLPVIGKQTNSTVFDIRDLDVLVELLKEFILATSTETMATIARSNQ